MLIADVAVPVPLAKPFSYEVPSDLALRVAPGARVLCDFGRRQIMGVVLSVSERQPAEGVSLKPLRAVVESQPVVSSELLEFLKALASYYFAPIGAVLRLALPAVERTSVERLEGQGELLSAAALSGTKRVSAAREIVASATSALEPPGTLRGQAREVLVWLRANGATPVSKLEERFSNARAATKRLESLGLVELEKKEKALAPIFDETVARDTPPALTPQQREAVDRIVASLRGESDKKSHLLFGVTGSGKTEVYLHAIEVCLSLGRGAIVMVPEIALTPQLVSRFRARFGDDVAVIHSQLTDRARHEMHKRLLEGRVRAAIGARSALFAPVTSLGLVIVDEEHDGSFKQEEGVRYHARDMALLRAHRAGATVVLGSATPSLESFELANKGKIQLIRLPDRARSEATLPDVTVVDLKRVGAGPSGHKLLSLPLHRAIVSTLEKGEQAIVFLNRRGHSPTVVCGSCGHVATCHACSVALTFHRRRRAARSELDGVVRCHYCGYEDETPSECPECHSREILLEGLGTEKLEETIAEAFPQARVERLDRDVADGDKGKRILRRMRDKEIDILVGTQMVTKGHDFPDVTLVGVVNADSALNLPDFRAAERAFQLLVQVAGRAGRHERKGRVFIQTYSPGHHAIELAKNHDVEGFLERELRDRRETSYPPFARLALVRLDAIDLNLAERSAAMLAEHAKGMQVVRAGHVEVLGPAPAPLARLRGRYRYRLLLRAADRPPLRSLIAALEPLLDRLDKRVRAAIDVDPVSML
ncbi:MAG: primosomal protein N' [Polyangiaceae bacterium]|nr:primosomal protein N' [Polyangiaceae bacterium]